MTLFQNFKFRSAKLFSAFAAVTVLGTAGGYAAHVYAAEEDCCYPGAACCHPGAACCAARHKAQQN
jgi:hypothetical protein